jgi:hypothetical protein
MCYVETVYHLVGCPDRTFPIWTPDLDDPPFQHEASEEVKTPGEMKASVHIFHNSISC